MLQRALIVIVLLGACIAPSAQALDYNIDGGIGDWGVDLETYTWHSWFQWGVSFVQSSFTPDPLGTIDYTVEDYAVSDSRPAGGEYYDYEAAYFDDSPGWFYVGIISSHPWLPGESVVEVTANGITISAEDFNQFETDSLHISEVIGGRSYRNYFYEGAIASDRFGDVFNGMAVTVYANCCICNLPPPDSITLHARTDNVVPEPASIALVGLALTALAGRQWRRRRSA